MKRRRLLILGLMAVLACGAIAWAQPKTLYEKQSRYNTIVVTEDQQGLRTLWFEKGGARVNKLLDEVPGRLLVLTGQLIDRFLSARVHGLLPAADKLLFLSKPVLAARRIP